MKSRTPLALASAASAAALLSLPGTWGIAALDPLVPHASAEEASGSHRTVSSGSLQWGVRESFRRYVEQGVAAGSITTGGGASRTSSGFTFPLRSSALASASSGQIDFEGEVHFVGHHGALDMTLSNPIFVVNGSSAELRVDYASRKYEGVNAVGELRQGRQELLATISLSAPANFSSSTVSLSGPVRLSATGAEIFGGFYEAGEALDPIELELTLVDAAGPAPSPSFSVGGSGVAAAATRSKATSGPAALLGTVNDTLVEVNGLLTNTSNVLTSGQSLYSKVYPTQNQAATAGGAHGTSGTSGTSGTAAAARTSGGTAAAGATGTSNGSATGASPSAGKAGDGAAGGTAAGGTQPSTAGAGGASGAAEDTSGACTASDGRGIAAASAEWGVRQSFRTYIRGSIARGGWELRGVEDNGKAFVFTGASGAVDPSSRSGSILFPGAIRFMGHDGVLDTKFSNLEIQFNGTSGKLILNVSSNSPDGTPNEYGRITLADLNFSALEVSDTSASGTATSSLTEAGAEAFGQFYPAGDALDPISFTAQLSGIANCAEGQGASTSGRATGNGGSASDASKLRAGGAGASATAQSKLTGGTTGAGNVLDEPVGGQLSTSAAQPEGGKFQIKNAATREDGGWSDGDIAQLLVLLTSLTGAGAAGVRFALQR